MIERTWNAGDTVELVLPLAVRKVLCDERVTDNRGKAALQRGPLVYCVEGRDADVPLDEVRLVDETAMEARRMPVTLVESRASAGRVLPPFPTTRGRTAGRGQCECGLQMPAVEVCT